MASATKKRALVVDGQLFQSYTFHRGMGKYSLSLLEELDKLIGYYDQRIIILNEHEMPKEERAILKQVAPSFSFVTLNHQFIEPGQVTYYESVTNHNRQITDEFLNAELPDYDIDFLILSLFQESECPVFPLVACNKYLVAYDLIPFQFPHLYLREVSAQASYLTKYKVLLDADHFFPISETVAFDLTAALGIPAQNITPIFGAQIKRGHIKPQPVAGLTNQRFILLPSGDDFRKNNYRAVQAFNVFNGLHNHEYKLVITSGFTDKTKAELSALSEAVYFSGNVTEAELAWLYKNAAVVFFPTEYEGLGMPVLEAVEFSRPVVCSDIQVFREMSSDAFVTCDPYDIESMAKALGKALTHTISKKAYDQLLQKYNWGKTAQLLNEHLLAHQAVPPKVEKKKVAIFAPPASGFSAIGKIVQEQHYVFSRYADIDYYLEQGVSDQAKAAFLRASYITYVAPVFDPLSLDESRKKTYDKIIYHIGNGEYHVNSLAKALCYPDTVILHDTNIEGMYGVAQAVGIISPSRLEAERHLEKLVKPKNGHFLSSLVTKQRAVVVHSKYAEKAVQTSLVPGANKTLVQQLNLPLRSLYTVDSHFDDQTFVVGLAGVIHQDKGLDYIQRIAAITPKNKNLKLKIFGFSLIGTATEQALHALGNIELIKQPSDMRFLSELQSCDLILNYRPNYHGETSLSTLESLRLGKDVIVNDTGWFAELPEGIVTKVTSPAEMYDSIQRKADAHTVETAALGSEKRRAYIATEHTIEAYLKAILEA